MKVNAQDRLTVSQAFVQLWIRDKVYRSEQLTDVHQKFITRYPPPSPPPPPVERSASPPPVESVEQEDEN